METKIITMTETHLEELLQRTVRETVSQMMTCGFTSINTREEDQLIGTAEACKILGCCSRTMQNYRDAKLISVVKVGPHKVLYNRREIEAFRDSHRVETRQIINHL